MAKAGLVSIDVDNRWIGGRYYLEHLVRCVGSLPPQERVELQDVSWAHAPESDPFSGVRDWLGEGAVVAPPASLPGRLLRKLRRTLQRSPGASDLFRAKGFEVFFPIPPCENSGMPYVFWLPDFQYLRRPDLLDAKQRDGFEQYFREHVGTAARVVLSSEDARNDFAKVFPESIDRTHVVRFCSVPDEDWWRLDPAQAATERGLPERYLMVCNQLTRHKNHLVLVRALDLLSQRGMDDIHVVCTGSKFDHRQEDYVGQVEAELARAGLSGRFHILGLIPRAEQIALMRRSVAMLQPSCFEGWSTTVEDAKTLGKLMVASNLPVHREQLGADHPYYLDLDDAEPWAQAIAEVWRAGRPGPHEANEAAGLRALEANKRACGQAFVAALRAAMDGRQA